MCSPLTAIEQIRSFVPIHLFAEAACLEDSPLKTALPCPHAHRRSDIPMHTASSDTCAASLRVPVSENAEALVHAMPCPPLRTPPRGDGSDGTAAGQVDEGDCHEEHVLHNQCAI